MKIRMNNDEIVSI